MNTTPGLALILKALAPGLNVMALTSVYLEMKTLVVLED